MLPPEFFDYVIKIILSILLGGLIGIEREITHHWAGFRTHILVCLGATLFMFISTFQVLNLQSDINFNIDVTRVAAGVVTGIGFLGAGVIFKEGASVKGLTTAASIWVTAAVGLLVGVGEYILGIISTVFILLVLYSDFIIEKKLFKSREVMFLNIKIIKKPGIQTKIERLLTSPRIIFSLKDFKREEKSLSFVYKVILSKYYSENITRQLLKDTDILKVSWTE
ncbi:MgtC/SapB family protein [[Eubacterium] cellulosolvens]